MRLSELWIGVVLAAVALALLVQMDLVARWRRGREAAGRASRWEGLVRTLELRDLGRSHVGRGRHGAFALRAGKEGVVVLVPLPPGTMLAQLSVLPRGRSYVAGSSPVGGAAEEAFAQGDRLRRWLEEAPARWVEDGQLAVELPWDEATPAAVRRELEALAEAARTLAGG